MFGYGRETDTQEEVQWADSCRGPVETGQSDDIAVVVNPPVHPVPSVLRRRGTRCLDRARMASTAHEVRRPERWGIGVESSAHQQLLGLVRKGAIQHTH
jgi:hypothetical protein